MPITESQSQRKYLAALRHLIDIGGSINATSELRRAAKRAIMTLSIDFINIRLNMIELRHEQVAAFVSEMEGVLAVADSVTPFSAITKLTDLVDTTRLLLDDSVAEVEEADEEDDPDDDE